jgi:hypothetical protein
MVLNARNPRRGSKICRLGGEGFRSEQDYKCAFSRDCQSKNLGSGSRQPGAPTPIELVADCVRRQFRSANRSEHEGLSHQEVFPPIPTLLSQLGDIQGAISSAATRFETCRSVKSYPISQATCLGSEATPSIKTGPGKRLVKCSPSNCWFRLAVYLFFREGGTRKDDDAKLNMSVMLT